MTRWITRNARTFRTFNSSSSNNNNNNNNLSIPQKKEGKGPWAEAAVDNRTPFSSEVYDHDIGPLNDVL